MSMINHIFTSDKNNNMNDLFKYNSTNDLTSTQWECLRAKVIGGTAISSLRKKYSEEQINIAEMGLVLKGYFKANGLTSHKGRMVFGWDTGKTQTGQVPRAIAGGLRPSGNGK